MVKSQELTKKEIMGREKDIKALDRINKAISDEKSKLSQDYDGTTKEPSYEKMKKEDLVEYKQDLAKRLMLFETEASDIRIEIKKISKIQNN